MECWTLNEHLFSKHILVLLIRSSRPTSTTMWNSRIIHSFLLLQQLLVVSLMVPCLQLPIFLHLLRSFAHKGSWNPTSNWYNDPILPLHSVHSWYDVRIPTMYIVCSLCSSLCNTWCSLFVSFLYNSIQYSIFNIIDIIDECAARSLWNGECWMVWKQRKLKVVNFSRNEPLKLRSSD